LTTWGKFTTKRLQNGEKKVDGTRIGEFASPATAPDAFEAGYQHTTANRNAGGARASERDFDPDVLSLDRSEIQRPIYRREVQEASLAYLFPLMRTL
jgi:hypothetical protein